jgi:hypothetical protein
MAIDYMIRFYVQCLAEHLQITRIVHPLFSPPLQYHLASRAGTPLAANLTSAVRPNSTKKQQQPEPKASQATHAKPRRGPSYLMVKKASGLPSGKRGSTAGVNTKGAGGGDKGGGKHERDSDVDSQNGE